MYRETTPWKVAKAVGVWLFGTGVFLLPFFVIQLGHITWPGATALAGFALIGGGIVYFGSRFMLRRIDAANRPLLLSEQGHTVMRGREEFAAKVVQIRQFVLWGFVATAGGFVFAISQHSCGTRDDGICGIPRLTYDQTLALQLIAIALGAAYVALAVLRTVHENETDRISELIAEGRRQRRGDDPFAGTRREGWDFD